MAQETETLKILQKLEDFVDYAYPALKQFPKSERHDIVADMKRSMDIMVHRDSEALQKKILDEFILQRKRNETQEPIHLQPPARDLQAAP